MAKVEEDKWYLVIDPNGEWALTDPISAADAISAIKQADEDAILETNQRWRVFELVGPGYEDFKSSIEVTPA